MFRIPQRNAGRALAWLTFLLLALGGVRLFELVLHRPILTYGDNYDMIRIMPRFNLWPMEGTRGLNDFTIPLRQYVNLDFGTDWCVYSSQMLLALPAAGMMAVVEHFRPGTIYDIRALGFSQAILLMFIALFYSRRFLALGHPWAAVLNAAIFTFVVTDPVNTLYLSGFYTDASAIIFLYFSLAAGALYVVAGPTKARAAAIALGLLLLATCKQQHLPTGLIVGGCVFIAGYVRWRRFPLGLTVSLAAASCAALALYLWQYGGESPAISVLRRCNITNATFAGFLPYAKNKPRAVALVGLPPHSNQYVGMNWYDPRMAGGHPCHEVFKVSRLSLLYLCWDDPTILWRMLNRALFDLETDCYGLLPIDLGNVEGVSRGRVPRPTVSDLVLQLGYYPRRIFYLLPAAIVAFYLLRAVVGLRRSWPPGPGILVIMAGLIAYSSFTITILGDGFLDYVRHNLLAINLLLVIYLTAAGHFAWWVGRRWFAVAGAVQQPAETAANVPSKSHRFAAWCAAAGATALYLGLTAGAVLMMREPYPHVAFEQSKVDASLGHCGTAENVLRGANDQLLLFGWAYDRRNQSRAARIIITCDGIPLPVHVLRGMPRRDVETGLGLPPTARIGWETSIPARLAKRGCWLNFYAVLDDGKIVELRKGDGVGMVR